MNTHTHTHTPGPWQNQRNHSGQVISKKTQRDFETNETKMLCFMVRNEDYFPVEESDANARLIAAAPDLLQVARDFLLLAALHDWEGAAIDFAKATVAKAEGVK
jgi:hypothetical protein